MKSRLVGFLKQAKNHVGDYFFNATPSRSNFLTAVAPSKRVWDQSEQRRKERSCVCKQN